MRFDLRPIDRLLLVGLLCFALASCGSAKDDDNASTGHAHAQPCQTDSQCTNGALCEQGFCMADVHGHDDCKINSDCQRGAFCDHGHCVSGERRTQSCTTEATCNPGELCTDGFCTPMHVGDPNGCLSDADCGNGHVCDWKNECCKGGDCIHIGPPECQQDADCNEGDVCYSNVCYRGDITYTNHTQAIYESMCAACHGEKLQEGDWRWDSYESLVQPSITCPGQPTAVCTMMRIRAGILPTLGNGLEQVSDAQIGLLAAWIAGGLKK